MSDPNTPPARGWALYWPAFVALIVGFLFTAGAAWATRGWERAHESRQLMEHFGPRALDVSRLVQGDLSRQVTAVEGVEALFEASEDVTRAEFATFTERLLRQTPNVRRFAWAPRVTEEERAAFESAARRDQPGFTIRAPDGEHLGAQLMPLTYLSPANPERLGLDLASMPVLREPLARAGATGRTATAGPISLASTDGGDGVGMVILIPFYRAPGPGLAPRWQGCVVELLDVGGLVAQHVGGIDAWLADGSGRPLLTWQNGVRVAPALPPAEGLVRRVPLTLGDQVWTLTLGPAAPVPPASPAAAVVLVGGMIASTIGAGYLARLRRLAADLSTTNGALREEMARRADAERTRERLSHVLESTSDLVAISDPEGHVLYLNHAGRALLGIPEHEDLSHTLLSDLLSPSARAKPPPGLAASEEPWQGETELRARTGEEIAVLGVAHDRREPTGRREYRSAIVHDIRERKAAERRLERVALYDELTELPNRRLLERRLGETLAAAGSDPVAVLLLTPDRFRLVSFSLGPAGKETLLRALARRLGQLVRPGEILAWYLDDTFALVVPSATPSRVRRVRDALFEAMAEPFVVDGVGTVSLDICVGASLFPVDGRDPDTLLRHAHAALLRAVELGGGTFQAFTASLHRRLEDRVELEGELRGAVDRDELTLYYQPQMDLQTGRLSGWEALMRWRHPRRGILSPASFLEVAEESRLILPIGEWAMTRAAQDAAAWRAAGLPTVPVGVNLSSYQLGQADLEPRLRRAIREGGLRQGELELELTESALMADPEAVRQLLGRLRDDGCRIAIDDFGTGYSSLAYLQQLPIDRLKIDQSFVRKAVGDPRSAAIVRTIIALARNIGLSTIAEGVAERSQLEFLRAEGCQEMQGYLVSPPVPSEKVPEMAKALAEGMPA